MNNDHRFVLVHDVGTTGNKACLYRLGKSIELVDSHLVEYPLYILENGGVEQKADEWWAAITESTKKVIQQSGITPDAIQGMAFCAQMQGFIPVDQNGVALRNPLSYMDSRSSVQIERYLYDGLIKINGWNAFKLLRWLQVTGGAAATVKDPLWKYLWVHDNEPDVFAAMHRWMDVKDYLVLRSTGEFAMGYDSAHATFLFDTRPGKLEWHEGLCRTFDVDLAHLPKVIGATDVAGKLQAGPAKELGLPAGLPLFGGGGD
ncbi:MAG: carbohydrate kinase, partial [Chloroflexi bacterium]